MVDNTVLNSGSGGDTIATDDIGGIKHQRVKIQYGADGSATDVSDSNPLPVDDAGGSLTVDNAGTFATQVDGDALTALQLIDDPVATDDTTTHATGTTKVMGIGAVAAPTDGSVDANDIGMPAMSTDRRLHTDTQIVGQDADITIADGGNIITVDGTVTADAGAGTFTVDNAGTFATQVDGAALTALQLIDDIVATDDTSTHATGTTKGAVVMAAATPTDGSVEANDLGAVAMSTDRRLHTDAQIVGQDADITIADGGNSITVDGTVTANAGTGTFTVDNAGTFATQVDGAALTALQLIDDAVHTDDAAFTLGTGKGVMVMGFAGTQSVNANDAAALACDTDGALHVSDGGNSLTVDGTVTANLSATDNTVLDNIDTNTGNVDTNTTNIPNVIGTDGAAGPTSALSVAGTESGGNLQEIRVDSDGHIQNDVLSIAAGSNLVGDVGLSGARTSGGTTLYKNIDVDESEDQIKGTAGQVYWIHAINLAAAVRYLKFYNATAASVTVGVTVPDLTFPVPTQGDTNGAGFTLSIPNGIAFGTAITIAATTGVGDGDSGAPGANEVIVNLGYA